MNGYLMEYEISERHDGQILLFFCILEIRLFLLNYIMITTADPKSS